MCLYLGSSLDARGEVLRDMLSSVVKEVRAVTG